MNEALAAAIEILVSHRMSLKIDQAKRDIIVEVTSGSGLTQQYRRHLLPDEITDPWVVKREMIDMIDQAKLCFDLNPKNVSGRIIPS